MDSKSFRSFDGHLDKREKLLVKIGWSQLNACCLILLWEGLERGLFVRKDIPLCSQILLMRIKVYLFAQIGPFLIPPIAISDSMHSTVTTQF